MRGGPTIRPAAASDAAPLARLLTELGYPAVAAVIPVRLARLAGEPRAAALLAERDGEVAGLVTVHVFSSIHDDAPVAWLTTLVVAGTAHGQGIGRALVQAASAFARTHGCLRISVTTALHRAGAHAFYQRLGWVHTGRRYTNVLEDPPARPPG